jgi:hypothetical protein
MRSHELDGSFRYLFGGTRQGQRKPEKKKPTKNISAPVPLAFLEQQSLPSGISLSFLEQASRPLSAAFTQALDGATVGKAIASPSRHAVEAEKSKLAAAADC